jgi:hypothetical protein
MQAPWPVQNGLAVSLTDPDFGLATESPGSDNTRTLGSLVKMIFLIESIHAQNGHSPKPYLQQLEKNAQRQRSDYQTFWLLGYKKGQERWLSNLLSKQTLDDNLSSLPKQSTYTEMLARKADGI